MGHKYDFSGYATRNDLVCSDGRTIRRNAFIDQDGATVPLVWQHQHNAPDNVLGHALLENRKDGVYAYCTFNNTPMAMCAKEAVENRDITHMSIYANKLKQDSSKNVMHGSIKEVSLVIAGANPGAVIDFPILEHGDGYEEPDEAIIFMSDNYEIAVHADDEEEEDMPSEEKKTGDSRTIKDVLDTFNDEQKKVLEYLVGKALADAEDGEAEHSDYDDDEEIEHSEGDYDDDEEIEHSEGDYDDMKYNVFEGTEAQENEMVLSHDDMEEIFRDGKRLGSLKESVLAHADDYGITDIEMLFPDARTLTNTPEFIKRETEWVAKVMNGTKHSPFSRIKSIFADITEDEARAKGYIKGKYKKEEVFSLLKRTTTPTTIYKKQKMDRDDVLDITSFDVLVWIKQEMRMMLEEEIARAVLIGDGRLASSDDKINEQCIRPVWKEEDLFTVKLAVDKAADTKDIMNEIVRSRKLYKGSGNPTFFTTEDFLTDMLLLEDGIGHKLYKSVAEVATALRVKDIVTVEVMENQTRTVDGKANALIGLIVNLTDYTIGADRGGQTSFFEDFDLDYNQMKYLYETRMSGALTKPFSAIAVERKPE